MGRQFRPDFYTDVEHVRGEREGQRYGWPSLRIGTTVRRGLGGWYGTVVRIQVPNAGGPPILTVQLDSTADGRAFRKKRTETRAASYFTLSSPHVRDGAETVV